MGIPEYLTIVFLILKTTGTISWGWVWVFSPLWIPIMLLGILFFIELVKDYFSDEEKERRVKQKQIKIAVEKRKDNIKSIIINQDSNGNKNSIIIKGNRKDNESNNIVVDNNEVFINGKKIN